MINIMSYYICEPCNYTSNDARNYKRHINSKRHSIKINEYSDIINIHSKNMKITSITINKSANTNLTKEYSCTYCSNMYSTLYGKNKHELNCSKKKIDDIIASKDAIIDEVKSEAKRNIAIIREKNKRIIQYEKEIELYRNTIEMNNEDKKMSKFKFINKNYQDVEPLPKLPYEKFRENRNILYIDNYDNKDNGIVQDVIHAYNHDMLDSYIGDIILKFYNNEKLEERQIWVTDYSRLKFIVRKKKTNGEFYWYNDNGGDYTNRRLIKPTICKIKRLLQKYQKKINNKIFYDYNSIIDKYNQEQIIKKNETILSILSSIDNLKIHKKILRYIAPKLLTRDSKYFIPYI